MEPFWMNIIMPYGNSKQDNKMSEKNKSKASKKWLISRMKTSGSKRRYVYSKDYADTRNAKKNQSFESLPSHESMSKSLEFYNGKINTDLLKRFLTTQIDREWEVVYAEVLARIPNKLLEYKDVIYWYVADKVELRAGQLWNLRNQNFIQTNTEVPFVFKRNYSFLPFYVDPQSHRLQKIGDFKSKKATRDLSAAALKEYRAAQQKEKHALRKEKKKKNQEQSEIVRTLLSNHKPNT